MAKPNEEQVVAGNDRPYEIIIGGATLVKDGKVIATVEDAVTYRNLGYGHVQGVWRFLVANKPMRNMGAQYNQVVGAEMTKFGDQYGLEAGRVTSEELALADSIVAKSNG